MAQQQFTPGPLAAVGREVWVYRQGAPAGMLCRSEPETPTGATYGQHDVEVVANAHLFAAAPDLYAELQQFVNGVETRMIDSPADETLANITRRARNALAKARGEQVQS